MRWSILGMKRMLVFSCVLTLLFTSPTWAQKKPQVHRARTDDGFWYIKQGNPQKISHYMREMGLTYLEWVQKAYEANASYWISAIIGARDESAKLALDSAEEILDQVESRMKINTQAPGDKDFLSVLKNTRYLGGFAAHVSCHPKDEGGYSCPPGQTLMTFISCKAWVQESIDSGIFEDSWHEGCYGDWAEKHKEKENEDASSDSQSRGLIGISRGERQGITITQLIAGGPAQRAGLAVGDVITAINGNQVKEASEEAELLSSRPQGAALRVAYVRGTQGAEVQLVLGSTLPLRVRVSSGVSTGLLIKKVTPTYPQLAKQARIQGTVVLEAKISKDGTIQNLQLISGHPMLAAAAIDAVKLWQYKPYYLKGEAVDVETQVVVNFSLSDGP